MYRSLKEEGRHLDEDWWWTRKMGDNGYATTWASDVWVVEEGWRATASNSRQQPTVEENRRELILFIKIRNTSLKYITWYKKMGAESPLLSSKMVLDLASRTAQNQFRFSQYHHQGWRGSRLKSILDRSSMKNGRKGWMVDCSLHYMNKRTSLSSNDHVEKKKRYCLNWRVIC